MKNNNTSILIFMFTFVFLMLTVMGHCYADDSLLDRISALSNFIERLSGPFEKQINKTAYHLSSKYNNIDSIVNLASKKFSIDAKLIKSIIAVESGGNPHAISQRGALGVMQLMPDTAKLVGVKDPFNPSQNIFGGTYYYRVLYNTFGSHKIALMAYNCGPQCVINEKIPTESVRYANKVLRLYTIKKEGRD